MLRPATRTSSSSGFVSKPIKNRSIFNSHSNVTNKLNQRRNYAASVPTEFYKTLNKIIDHNKVGDIPVATSVYDELLNDKNLSKYMNTPHYNKIISSFAPRKHMWQAFVQFQDINEMYYQTSGFRPSERAEEAQIVLQDMERAGVERNVVTMNSLMKVYLTCGETGIQNMFDTLATMPNDHIRPNMASLATMMRGLSILGAAEDALLVYNGALSIRDQSSILPSVDDNNIFIHNLVLDTLAEAKDDRIDSIYESVVDRGIADGGTFTAYIKSLILRDLKQHLPQVAEVMRVNGVLQKELTKTAQHELHQAYRQSMFPTGKWSYLHRNKMQQVVNDDVPDYFLPVRRVLLSTGLPYKGKGKESRGDEEGGEEGEEEGSGDSSKRDEEMDE
eukprot:gb/GECH01013383.1/.p1 GENE.gb/GECH01013383.1/~~gb/GECH01013383.1/.p1  ORF type:complete len:389 (+),score=104.51 gb/GECH01013383.1/:1-1167(+)